MEILFLIFSVYVVFQPLSNSESMTFNSNNKEEAFVIDTKKYHNEIREDAIIHNVPQKYIDRLDTVIYRMIDDNNDKNFMDKYFGSLDQVRSNGILAMCDNLSNIIYFRLKALRSKSKYQIQETFDHEVGHCVLGRIHRNNEIQFDGFVIPESVMNDNILIDEQQVGAIYVVDHYRYYELKKKYRDELFNLKRLGESEKIAIYKDGLYKKNINLNKIKTMLVKFEIELLKK